MTHIAELTVFTSDAHGKWVAATGCAPYFCFEAETEEKALALAAAALKFYVGSVVDAGPAPGPNFERFQPKNRIRASELAAA